MKKVIIFAVAFVAVFVVSLKVNSTPKGIDPNYYCKYDASRAECDPLATGPACYGVNEDCSWMN